MNIRTFYEYYEEVDGLYIWFINDIEKEKRKYSREVWPKDLKEEIGLLFDHDGKLMGLEIQPASKYIYNDILKRK